MNKNNNPPQFTLFLRLFCAGYLLYTAWDLREAFQESPVFIVGAIIFVVFGLVLGVHSIIKLVRKEYTVGKTPFSPAAKEPAESADQTDE